MMKQGHLYERRDGEVFLQEKNGYQSGAVWHGSDGRVRWYNGRMRRDFDHECDAVRDLGPEPTWKEVVEMREELERLLADLDAAAEATGLAGYDEPLSLVDAIGILRSDLQSMAANRDDLLQRNTEMEAENAELRKDRDVASQRLNEWNELVEIARRVAPVLTGPNVAKDCVAVFSRLVSGKEWLSKQECGLEAENADLRAKLAKESEANRHLRGKVSDLGRQFLEEEQDRERLDKENADLRAKLALHERRLASGAEEPLGCPTPGACSCPVERANSVREAVAALKTYAADTDAELADAARTLAVGDYLTVKASGRVFRVALVNENDTAFDGTHLVHRESCRRATPAEIDAFEAKERGGEPLEFQWNANAHRVRQAAKDFSESAKEHRLANQRSHVLYETGDKDAPGQILDRNGDVVLGMCRKCGRAEAELDEPCEKEERAKTKPATFVDLTGRKIPPIPAGRRLVTDYAEEPHPEAMVEGCGSWVHRVSSDGYKSPHEYIVPLVYDVEIPWRGGPCPVAEETWVEVETADGEDASGKASWFDWGLGPNASGIVAYTVPSPKPAEPDFVAVEKPSPVVENSVVFVGCFELKDVSPSKTKEVSRA